MENWTQVNWVHGWTDGQTMANSIVPLPHGVRAGTKMHTATSLRYLFIISQIRSISFFMCYYSCHNLEIYTIYGIFISLIALKFLSASWDDLMGIQLDVYVHVYGKFRYLIIWKHLGNWWKDTCCWSYALNISQGLQKSLIVLYRKTVWILKLWGRCNEAATCDVMMDKSKYFFRFVKFSVGNVISNKYLDGENDMLNLDIWPLG